MTTREIALEARRVLNTTEYFLAQKLLKNHIEIANRKMQEFSKRINKELGTHKSPPKIRVITDFLRFK